jgi:AcrR family transcriptional regulator
MASRDVEGKGQRRYDSRSRRERARLQREATLDRAWDLFLHRGYAGTTVESIASDAGVSAATIYKTYGGKAGLVRELCQRALAGAGPVPAEQRSNALRTGSDPRALIDGWGALLAEVSPRVSPLLLLLRAAADSDGDAAALYAELDGARLERMTDNAAFLFEVGHLRDGVTVEDACDVLWFCSSPELYELLVLRRGWPAEKLGVFTAAMMAGALLA